MAISRQQFGKLADQVNAPGGGFSVNLKTGEAPTTGYMVSYAGTEEVHAPPVAGSDIEHYAKRVPIRQRRGSYLGGWHKDEPDEWGPEGIFLDRSMNITTPGVMGRAEAVLEMAKQDQQSMYYVDTGTVENNPYKGQKWPDEVQETIKRQYEQARG